MKELKLTRSLGEASRTEAVVRYLNDVKEVSVNLTADEEASLAKRIREGDRAALNELVNCNLRFVISAANQYSDFAPLEDLINEGNMGLIEAAKRFDETRGVKFVSYAVWQVRERFLKYISQVNPMIRIPRGKSNDLYKYREIERFLEQAFERKPVVSEIADVMNASGSRHYADSYVESLAQNLSVHTVPVTDVFGLYDETESEDSITDPLPDLTDSHDIEVTVRRDIESILNKLTSKERYVIVHSFGLGCPAKTNEELAQEFGGISRERVRQIKERGLKKLKAEFKDPSIFFEL